jgi:phosphonate transport system substrate-binding protein
MRTRKALRAAAVAALCLALPARAGDPLTEAMTPLDPKAPITFGVGQPNGPKRAAEGKALLEPYLAAAMKRPVTVVILEDYEALADALAAGKVDLAWTTPVSFVRARQRNGEVQAVAKSLRRGKLFYRAAFIVRAGSAVQSLADLEGKSVAWVSKGSASGYLFPRALLAAQGKSPDRFFARQSFAGDHPGVCDAVRAGKAEAGATFSDERPPGEKLTADGCAESPPVSDFRVVASSGPIPNDVIAARPGFDERLVEPTLALFAQMSQGEEGRRVLREVFRVDGWGLAVDGDFRPVVEALKVAAPAGPAATSPRKPARPGK